MELHTVRREVQQATSTTSSSMVHVYAEVYKRLACMENKLSKVITLTNINNDRSLFQVTIAKLCLLLNLYIMYIFLFISN